MKYHNKKVVRDGETFDSVKEYHHWIELCLMEKAGLISDLQRQVKYVLIPSQYQECGKKKKCIERECSYISDFSYFDSDGKLHVEDVKGYKGGGAYAVFKIKRKLMLYIHNIIVEEV